MSTRRPLTEAEKQRKREQNLLWWATNPKAAELREKRRQARIEYNKTKVAERLSPEARRRAGERLAHVNKTRERPAAERLASAERMRDRNVSGKMKRGPLTEVEREAIRQRMLGNDFGKFAPPQSPEQRQAASDRMKQRNPMKDAATVRKMRRTLTKKHGKDYSSRLFKRLWAEGRIKGRPLSENAKQLARERMTASNPMKDPKVVTKARKNFSVERRLAASERMKQTWQEGKIIPAMFMGKGNVKGANKTERQLFPILRYHHGRFVGDGSFWIKGTASGICRNPDFIFGSGKRKTALLVHGTYWHRDEATAQAEIDDYLAAGWNVFVLWTKRIAKWMLPPIKVEIKLWLADIESSQSQTPVLRQFMTWNADRTITS